MFAPAAYQIVFMVRLINKHKATLNHLPGVPQTSLLVTASYVMST